MAIETLVPGTATSVMAKMMVAVTATTLTETARASLMEQVKFAQLMMQHVK